MKLLDFSNPYLHVGIIEQILLLLPAKSIGRCRCLSKQWRALLSSPQFIKAHASIIRTRALQAHSVSIFTYRSWLRFTLTNDSQVTASGALHNLHFPGCTYFMGSCDGLLLVLKNGSQTFLINPTTRRTRKIPTVIIRPVTRSKTTRINLDGIGFDSISNDYKVVSVSLIYNSNVDDSSHEVFVHTYSVNDGAWKSCISLPNFFGYRFCTFDEPGVFVGRCIHWVVQQDTDGIPIILAFDAVEEKLCQVPNPTHHSFVYPMIGVLGGCLYFSTTIEEYLNVWVMIKYGIQESWTKIARIEIKKALFAPLCLVGQQYLVLLLYHKAEKLEKLVSYNVAEKMFKDIDIPDNMKDDLDSLSIPLAETMVPPYGMRGRHCSMSTWTALHNLRINNCK